MGRNKRFGRSTSSKASRAQRKRWQKVKEELAKASCTNQITGVKVTHVSEHSYCTKEENIISKNDHCVQPPEFVCVEEWTDQDSSITELPSNTDSELISEIHHTAQSPSDLSSITVITSDALAVPNGENQYLPSASTEDLSQLCFISEVKCNSITELPSNTDSELISEIHHTAQLPSDLSSTTVITSDALAVPNGENQYLPSASTEDLSQLCFISEVKCNRVKSSKLKYKRNPNGFSKHLQGLRIVDLNYVLSWALVVQQEHSKKCKLGKLSVAGESRNGLSSVIVFQCDTCFEIVEKCTERHGGPVSEINFQAVRGTLSSGISFASLKRFLETTSIPTLSFSTFCNINTLLCKSWKNAKKWRQRSN